MFDRNNVRTMKFDDFIQCSVMLKTLTDAFRKHDTSQTGVININYEQVRSISLTSTMSRYIVSFCTLSYSILKLSPNKQKQNQKFLISSSVTIKRLYFLPQTTFNLRLHSISDYIQSQTTLLYH